jgi:hypothetical protein
MKTELELGLSLGTTSKTKPKTRFSIYIYEFFFQPKDFIFFWGGGKNGIKTRFSIPIIY